MIKNIQPRLAEAGKIKIGGLGHERKTRDGNGTWRAPVKLDHFLITKTTRGQDGQLEVDLELMAALEKDHANKVRALPIVLHSDEIDDVFPTSFAMYSGKKLACRGDGENAVRWDFKNGQRTGAYKQMACTCPYYGADPKTSPVCKPHGVLHCSITVPGRSIAGALYRWRTTSIISVQNILGSLQQILATVGALRGLPLWLVLRPYQVQPPGQPASTVYCCHLELRANDLLSVQSKVIELAEMRRRVSTVQIDYRALVALPASDAESDDEQAEVQEEFHPETGEVIDASAAPDVPAARLGSGAVLAKLKAAPEPRDPGPPPDFVGITDDGEGT